MTDIELIREAVEKLKAGCSTSDFFAALYELDTFNPAPVVNQQLTTDSKPSVQVPDKKSAKDAPIGMFEKEKSAWKTGWNMCRAAMLNQPANQQDKP